MLKKITLLAIIVLLASCISAGHLVQISDLPLNPISYEYPVSKASMDKTLLYIFSYGHLLNSRVYEKQGIVTESYPEGRAEYVYFRIKPRADDTFTLSPTDFIQSYIYADSGKPAKLLALYQIATIAISDSRVKVSIIPINVTAYYGVKCCGHFGLTTKSKQVPSETIVEYKLLRYIGDMLGLKNMPMLILPINNVQDVR
jgi:hypothetical protein